MYGSWRVRFRLSSKIYPAYATVMVDLEIYYTPTTIRHHCISRLLILTSYLFASSVGIENQNAQIWSC
ncbi:unnamed protein product [Lactuca virosa]|uniref:Uncharacterized protein n=1 Tax=Lactuca virosa TaxID=75947 RepID=A0AAU9MIG7_9ASTR|nr:unnamed protein product [Lactuca virosa]